MYDEDPLSYLKFRGMKSKNAAEIFLYQLPQHRFTWKTKLNYFLSPNSHCKFADFYKCSYSMLMWLFEEHYPANFAGNIRPQFERPQASFRSFEARTVVTGDRSSWPVKWSSTKNIFTFLSLYGLQGTQ